MSGKMGGQSGEHEEPLGIGEEKGKWSDGLGSVSDSANCCLGTLDESLGFPKQQFWFLQNEESMTSLRNKLGRCVCALNYSHDCD